MSEDDADPPSDTSSSKNEHRECECTLYPCFNAEDFATIICSCCGIFYQEQFIRYTTENINEIRWLCENCDDNNDYKHYNLLKYGTERGRGPTSKTIQKDIKDQKSSSSSSSSSTKSQPDIYLHIGQLNKHKDPISTTEVIQESIDKCMKCFRKLKTFSLDTEFEKFYQPITDFSSLERNHDSSATKPVPSSSADSSTYRFQPPATPRSSRRKPNIKDGSTFSIICRKSSNPDESDTATPGDSSTSSKSMFKFQTTGKPAVRGEKVNFLGRIVQRKPIPRPITEPDPNTSNARTTTSSWAKADKINPNDLWSIRTFKNSLKIYAKNYKKSYKNAIAFKVFSDYLQDCYQKELIAIFFTNLFLAFWFMSLNKSGDKLCHECFNRFYLIQKRMCEYDVDELRLPPVKHHDITESDAVVRIKSGFYRRQVENLSESQKFKRRWQMYLDLEQYLDNATLVMENNYAEIYEKIRRLNKWWNRCSRLFPEMIVFTSRVMKQSNLLKNTTSIDWYLASYINQLVTDNMNYWNVTKDIIRERPKSDECFRETKKKKQEQQKKKNHLKIITKREIPGSVINIIEGEVIPKLEAMMRSNSKTHKSAQFQFKKKDKKDIQPRKKILFNLEQNRVIEYEYEEANIKKGVDKEKRTDREETRTDNEEKIINNENLEEDDLTEEEKRRIQEEIDYYEEVD